MHGTIWKYDKLFTHLNIEVHNMQYIYVPLSLQIVFSNQPYLYGIAITWMTSSISSVHITDIIQWQA